MASVASESINRKSLINLVPKLLFLRKRRLLVLGRFRFVQPINVTVVKAGDWLMRLKTLSCYRRLLKLLFLLCETTAKLSF